MTTIPILLNHDHSKPIGKVSLEPTGHLVFELDEGHEITREQAFNIFGGGGFEVLEFIDQGRYSAHLIKKARIVEFSLDPQG